MQMKSARGPGREAGESFRPGDLGEPLQNSDPTQTQTAYGCIMEDPGEPRRTARTKALGQAECGTYNSQRPRAAEVGLAHSSCDRRAVEGHKGGVTVSAEARKTTAWLSTGEWM